MSTLRSPTLPAAAGADMLARRPLMTLLAMAALFLAAMDSTIVGTLLPFVKEELHDQALYPWLMSGFIVCSIIATPITGRLADALGERSAMQLALGLFLLGSAAVWWAPSMPLLVAARSFQGLGAGAVTVMAYILVGRLFKDAERGKMQGLLSLVWGLAAVVGPLAGALLHGQWGWRSAFAVNVPFCGLIMVLLAALYPGRRATAAGPAAPFDALSQALFVVLVASALLLVMAPSLPQLQGEARTACSAALLASAVLLLWRVRRRPEGSPLPTVFFAEARYAAPAAATVLASVVLYAAVTLLPLYLHQATGVSAVRAGLVVMSAALGWVVGSAVCGGLLQRLGHRWPVLVGSVALTLGGAGLFTAAADAPLAWFAAAQALIGLGIGFVATAALVLVQNQSPVARIGSFTAAVQLCRNLGAALGINVVASLQIAALRNLQAAQRADAWSASFAQSFGLLVGLGLLAFVVGLAVPAQAQRRG